MAAIDFEVIPAIDIQDGEVVQLVGGELGTGNRYGDPETAARRWVEAGAERLHLVDLDGAFAGERENADAIEAIVSAVDVPVQLGGGIRSIEDARALLERGIHAVILGTAALENPDIVGELSEEYPGRVIVSLDAKGGEVVIDGWTSGTGIAPEDAATRYETLGAAGILFTDVDVEGRLAGVRTDRVERMVSALSIPVIASGGVSSIADLQALAAAGADAAVVGTALYEERFSLADALAALD